jgi:restriction system protein
MSNANVPPTRPPFIMNNSDDAAVLTALWEQHRRRHYQAVHASGSINVTTGPVTAKGYATVFPPESGIQLTDDFPTLVNFAVVTPYATTAEGELIKAITIPTLEIVRRILKDPSLRYGVESRQWEKIVAASYEQSGRWDEVTLTPRSNDGGKDVIAVKHGFGSVRLIESIKRYTPGHYTTAADVRELLGVLSMNHSASKGVISTTWEFAPGIEKDPQVRSFMPTRLELVDGVQQLKRFAEYTGLTNG